jgi:L-malate glycosyltransferase
MSVAEVLLVPAVLQVVHSLGTGGTERLVIDIATRLRLRHPMAVCCLDEAGSRAHELVDRGVTVTTIGREPGFHPSLAYRIAQAARLHRADIIHCHHYSPFVYGRLATAFAPNTKLVFTEHGRLSDGPPSRKRRLVNPLLARLPATIVSVSSALRQSMIEEGFPGDRVRVIHNGIEPRMRPSPQHRVAARKSLELAADAVVVGTVARLDPVKDLDTLLRGFGALWTEDRRARLFVVGDGADRYRLEAAARMSDFADAVRFLGNRTDVRRLLPAFDVYANSSISEGISLTILEAMATGLPVVATAVGGTPEIIDDGRTGVLVPARQPAAIGGALIALVASRERRHALGAAARLAIKTKFTLDGMVAEYERIYCEMAS